MNSAFSIGTADFAIKSATQLDLQKADKSSMNRFITQ